MTKPYIQLRLDQLERNRLIGKPGLSMKDVRDSQVKVRFTEQESDLLSVLSKQLGQPKAVLSNVLLIDAIIDLLAEDPELHREVLAAWRDQGFPDLDFFPEIDKRAKRQAEPIEGEFVHMPPASHRLELVRREEEL
ncbi:hypothetical protein [Salinivibrio sp. YCSC6]|uniref:hypothetical protein n=1 Tax=Salinivibrio sp. YCSC6 TaxID=2003370 RepID=UPI000BBC5306|nr:hypothetical protein [Salinivibrio sp. YCSC6]PCE67568.1 hypothetical protein B6G00_04260 [Salinivibrio sp. YCSC6]QCF35527.1 hypothetical protein E8E00_04695 [Salinivibrio sp. YCSC6]